MTSSETRALRHAVLLILGLGFFRSAADSVRSPVSTRGASLQDTSGLAVLLDESRGSRNEAQRRSLPLTVDDRIDPNTAGEVDLDRLPGVGAAVAKRIVQVRQDRGPFVEPADLLDVPGVGPATLARITPYLEWSTRPGRRGAVPLSRPNADRPAPAPTRLDLNRAGREELQGLPGVGPVMADRILTLRESLGRFRSLEELQSVRGIGPATLERIRSLVKIGG